MFDEIAKHKDDAVEHLVNCLDNMEPVTVTAYRDGPVSLGAMCYVALTDIAYYEPEPEEDWEGVVIRLRPTLGELRAAKEAWRKIVKTKSYVLFYRNKNY